MKRVICLYRVSTVGQVDHDDIPMQRKACREYAAAHPDWEIVDEICEKGVSGYKISTNARDAIVEIKSVPYCTSLMCYWFSCLTAWAGAMTRRRLWSNGSFSRALKCGAHARASSASTTMSINC